MAGVSEFLAMGGYAASVWPAYAFTAAGLVGALVVSWRAWRTREREFEALRNTQRSTPPP
jgi:heme exporter protein D